MNKKTLVTGFLSAVVASSVLFTSSVSAFWPFDALFGKGSVKAAVTDKMRVESSAPKTTERVLQNGNAGNKKLLEEAAKKAAEATRAPSLYESLKTTISSLDQICATHAIPMESTKYQETMINNGGGGFFQDVTDKTGTKNILAIRNNILSECKRISALKNKLSGITPPKIVTPTIINATPTPTAYMKAPGVEIRQPDRGIEYKYRDSGEKSGRMPGQDTGRVGPM